MSKYEELILLSIEEHGRIRDSVMADLCNMLNAHLLGCIMGENSEVFHSFCEDNIPEVLKQTIEGKTPLSKTQLLKRLQQIIDHIIFLPNEQGDNRIKAWGPDIQYLLWIAATYATGIEAPVLMTFEQLGKHIYEVCSAIISGKGHSVCRSAWSTAPAHMCIRNPIPLDETARAFDPVICEYGVPKRCLLNVRELQPTSPDQCTCSYPSCSAKVWRDNFCWEHYQYERFTSRQ